MKKRVVTLSVITALLTATVAFGNTSIKEDTQRILKQTNQGAKFDKPKVTLHGYKSKEYYNLEESIYELYKMQESGTLFSKKEKKAKVAAVNIENAYYDWKAEEEKKTRKEKIKIAQAVQQAVQEKKEEQKKPPSFFARGYCRIENDIKVDRISTYVYLKCDLDAFNGQTTLAASLVPDFYTGALVAKPLYLTYRGTRFPVEQGVIMDGARSTINVANIVNDYRLKKYATAFGVNAANIVTKKAQEYLEQVQEANTQEKTNIIPGANGTNIVVKETNANQVDSKYYVATATVQLLSELVKAIGGYNLDSVDYTFYVKGGALLYADLQLKPTPKLKGIMIEENRLLRKNEKFDEKQYKILSEPIGVYDGGEDSNAQNGRKKRR